MYDDDNDKTAATFGTVLDRVASSTIPSVPGWTPEPELGLQSGVDSMAWIRRVDESEASSELSDANNEVASLPREIANIFGVQSLNPAAMLVHVRLFSTIMLGESSLSQADRDLIGLVVSNANGCKYGVEYETEALRKHKSDEEIDRIRQNVWTAGLSDRTMAMLVYALKLNRMPSDVVEADLNDLRSIGCSDQEIVDMNLVVSYFSFANRVALGLGVGSRPE